MCITATYLIRLFFAAFMVIFLTTGVLACGCPTIGFSEKELKEYYKNKFTGAVFTGEITTVKDALDKHKVIINDSLGVPMRELTINVSRYWVGVSKPVLSAYTVGGHTSCTVQWEIRTEYFFIASKRDGHFEVGMCDLSNWRGNFPNKEWLEFTERILGPAKMFSERTRNTPIPAVNDLLIDEFLSGVPTELKSQPNLLFWYYH